MPERWMLTTDDGDELLLRIERAIRMVLRLDLRPMDDWDLAQLVGHLTGAVFVTVAKQEEQDAG